MNDEIINILDDLITLESGSTSFQQENLPTMIVETEYIEKSLRPPTRCPVVDRCRAYCDCELDGSSLLVSCDHDHEDEIAAEKYMYYDISFEAVLTDVVDYLEYTLESVNLDDEPRYIRGDTAEGFAIYLIISPSDYEKTVNEICMETLLEDRPALLITPEDTVDELLEIQSLFAGGNLVYTIPFTMLTEKVEVQYSLEIITEIKTIERQVVQEYTDETHPVVYRVNSNPRYIMTELNHMRLLRLAGELPQSSGTRLEKVGESAFSHLFASHPDVGGEDDRGANLPDSVFFISNQSLPPAYDSILGIVDTKSGADASFGTETVEGKHDEYLHRGRRPSVPAEYLAHIFVILDFDGQQEIFFYDEMAEHYREGEYMVIITAEALAMIMAAYLAHTVANELTLVDGTFQTTIYPFFHKDEFRDAGLADVTRDVGRNQEGYDHGYMQREGLLIITPDVVRERLQDCMDSPNEIENVLSSYYRPMPTV